jgi:hypothetical protein
MVLISDELYELIMDNISDKDVREKVFEEKKDLYTEDRDALCSALETDANYWENVLKQHPNDNPNIRRHIRNYIKRDEALIRMLIKF